jgi:hypothetical protein
VWVAGFALVLFALFAAWFLDRLTPERSTKGRA